MEREGFSLFQRLQAVIAAAEAVARADLDGVEGEIDLVVHGETMAQIERRGFLAKIDMGVFHPDAEALGHGIFEADAGGPADMIAIAADALAESGKRRLNRAPGNAAEAVEQRLAGGIAQTRNRRRIPVKLALALDEAEQADIVGTVDIRAV